MEIRPMHTTCWTIWHVACCYARPRPRFEAQSQPARFLPMHYKVEIQKAGAVANVLNHLLLVCIQLGGATCFPNDARIGTKGSDLALNFPACHVQVRHIIDRYEEGKCPVQEFTRE